MSADNLIRIKKKPNGLYQVRYENASSLVHEMEGIEPTEEELLIRIIADDVDHEEARRQAEAFEDELDSEMIGLEYGIVGEDWKK